MEIVHMGWGMEEGWNGWKWEVVKREGLFVLAQSMAELCQVSEEDGV